MAGTVKALLDQTGDIVAGLSQALETLRKDVAKWSSLAPELDKAFDRVQKATAQITELEGEIATLQAKKASLQSGLDELRAKLGG